MSIIYSLIGLAGGMTLGHIVVYQIMKRWPH